MNVRDHFRAEFARLEGALPGRRLPWLQRARMDALAYFADTGLPTTRDENWKYTSVAPIEKAAFAVAGPGAVSDADDIEIPDLPDTHRLVFIDGRFEPRRSRLGALPAGVTIQSLREAIERAPEPLEAVLTRSADRHASAFAALNTAFVADGAFIRLAAGTAVDAAIHLVFASAAPRLAVLPRVVVLAEAGSRARIVEHHLGGEGAAGLTDAVTDIVAGEGAEIEHTLLQEAGRQAFHVGAIDVDQRRASRFASHAFALGARLARVDLRVGLNAENAACALNGLYLTGGRQHVDHHTRIDHAQPGGVSRELYKGMLFDASRAVFNGKVVVHAGAHGTDAQQSNRNLLLSEDAEVDTKPELEIYADDVKCSHGATVGQLDSDHLFYLRARGLDAAAARALLAFAFAEEVITRASVPALRARLEARLLGTARDLKELL